MSKLNKIEKKLVLEAFEKALKLTEKESGYTKFEYNICFFMGALEANLKADCGIEIPNIVKELNKLEKIDD